MGKTALLNHFLAESSAQVLRASGEESEVMLAYGVVDQLLRVDAVDSRYLEPRRVPLEDHLTVGAQLLDLLGRLQEQGPVIVAVDDVQWADQASLKALLFALRRLQVDRVLALLVTRTGELHRLLEGLSRLVRGGAGATVEMGGLETRDLRELAELMGITGFSAEAAERLRQHTEGSPLHAQALLAELPVEAWGRPEVSFPAPRSFGLLVLDRRAQCSEDGRRLIDAASVLGMRCSLDAAASLAGIEHPLQGLEEASMLGLLQLNEPIGERTIVFPHPLVHAAVYQGLGASLRAALHARAADLVIDPTASLRHRVAAASGADSRLAADLAGFAQEEARRGAWASAAAHLVKASGLSADRTERERLLLDAVNWMLFSGSLSQAAVFREQISSFVASPQRDCILGELALLEGRPAEAEELLASAWRQCNPATDAGLAATIALWNASHALSRFRATNGIEWARRALQLLGPRSPEAGRGRAVLSFALARSGRIAEAFAVLDSTEPTGLSEPEDWELMARGVLKVVRDDIPNARADLALVVTKALHQGSLQTAADALDWLAMAAYYSGAWDDVILHGERALLLYTESERPYNAFNPSALVAVAAARGDWLRAELHAGEAATPPLNYEFSVAGTAIAHAQLAAARSNHQAVLNALQPVLGFTYREFIDEPGFWPWQDLYADALVSLDRADEAHAFLRPHESLAAQRGRCSMMARLARVRGRIEAAAGRLEAANVAFLSALQHIEQLGMPFEQALIRLAFGSFLRRRGKRRDAVAQLLAARASLIKLGAKPYLERSERELGACGLTPRKRQDQDRSRLTPQEVSVARLVASGLTNREVAAELVLSTKTIEFHLRQIFDKLDITSRRQIGQHLQTSTRS
jgi:DNA-binding CsgD family transcriptional regulator